MEEWKLQLEAMQQRWEDGHTHLVRPEAAGEITHGGVQRERQLRHFCGSALDLSLVDWVENVRNVHLRWDLKRRAEISSDVDSEAPTDTKIRVGVSRKKSQLRGWRRRYLVTSIRRRRRRRRYKSAYLARSRN